MSHMALGEWGYRVPSDSRGVDGLRTSYDVKAAGCHLHVDAGGDSVPLDEARSRAADRIRT